MKMMSEHSAGGAVYKKCKMQNAKCKIGRKKQQKILWLVSKHSGYHKWVLPKGIVEKGEKAEETAMREVLEETGIKAEIVQKINFLVRYKYIKKISEENIKMDNRKSLFVNRKSQDEEKILVNKTVEFYLMRYAGGDIKNHSWEMEEVKWVTGEEAMRLLGFPGEREVLEEAKKLV